MTMQAQKFLNFKLPVVFLIFCTFNISGLGQLPTNLFHFLLLLQYHGACAETSKVLVVRELTNTILTI